MLKVELYTEKITAAEPMRQCYADSIDRAVEMLRADAHKRRHSWISPEKLAADPETYRNAYAEMLGIPACQRVFGTDMPEVEEIPAGEDAQCTIVRLKIRLAPGVSFTGLLFRPKNATGPVPLVITQHGGGGSPELCSDLIGPNNYNHMTRRVLERGAMAFAPQLLLWNIHPQTHGGIPQFGTKYDRSATNRAFRQTGTSIVGFEIYAISRSLDYLFAHENVLPDRCGMIGISYGGYYTLHTMAYETRIRGGYSAAIFNDRIRYGWHDMVWTDSAAKFLDSEVAGLCAPRKLWIEIGKTDPVFDYTSVPAVYDEAVPYFTAQNVPENIHLNLWDGGHTITSEPDGMDFLISALQ